MHEQTALQLREDDHLFGDEQAQFVVVQYGAYQSAASRTSWETLRQAAERQPQRLCVIYRHFIPSAAGTFALGAEEAAECAANQGRFWEMHELLYAHGDALDDGSLVEYAAQLQLDVPSFLRCMSTRHFQSRVARDLTSGQALGVCKVPALWFGNHRLTAADETNLAETLRVLIQEAMS